MNPLNALSAGCFTVSNILSRSETWESGFVVDNSQAGRQHHLIHVITEGRRIYSTEDRDFAVEQGTVLLIPHGTRYITRTESVTSGIGVCFDLSENIHLDPGVYCDWFDLRGEYLQLFERLHANAQFLTQDHLHCLSLLLRILDRMNRETANNASSRKLVEPFLRFIEDHYRENLSVKTYAEVCNLSESYFRSKFQESTGMTPVEYRDDLRFREARKMYAQGISISEIAEDLGFCDVSYFRKIYKKRCGVSIVKDQEAEMI